MDTDKQARTQTRPDRQDIPPRRWQHGVSAQCLSTAKRRTGQTESHAQLCLAHCPARLSSSAAASPVRLCPLPAHRCRRFFFSPRLLPRCIRFPVDLTERGLSPRTGRLSSSECEIVWIDWE